MTSLRLTLLTLFAIAYHLAEAQSTILFSRSNGGLNSGGTLDLMMYDPTDDKTTLLLKGSVRGRGEYNAVANPNGSKIVYNTYRFSGWKLGVADLENGQVKDIKKLTTRKNYEYCGKFSPDGQKIVYQEFKWSDRSENIYISNENGEDAKLFFENNISDQSLDWTKDGKSIVFTHLKNDRLGIYMKSINGKVFKNISGTQANDFAPATSKTENKVAFLSDRNGKIDLFVMNNDGSNLKNLTPNLNSKDASANDIWAYKISWSPNGKQLVFNLMIGNDLELFIVNADGSGLRQITQNNDSDITPFWMAKN